MGRIGGVSICEPLASFRRAASTEKCPRPTDDLVLLVRGMLVFTAAQHTAATMPTKNPGLFDEHRTPDFRDRVYPTLVQLL